MALKQNMIEDFTQPRLPAEELTKMKGLQDEWLSKNKVKKITYCKKTKKYKEDGEVIEESRPKFTTDAGGYR